MKRFMFLTFSVAASAVIAGYYVYPQWTMQRIERAFKERDTAVLEELIDWPRLRQGIKVDIAAQSLSRIVEQDKSSLRSAATALGAAALVDNLITAERLLERREVLGVGKNLSQALVDQQFTTPVTYVMDFQPSEAVRFSLMMQLQGLKWRVTRFIPSSELRVALSERVGSPNSDLQLRDLLQGAR